MSGMTECDCGNEGETPKAISLEACPICGAPSCNDCRHECADGCHTEGCEACMVKFQANQFSTLWFCGEDCRDGTIDPYNLARHSEDDKRNMRAALEQYLYLPDFSRTMPNTITAIKKADRLYLDTRQGGQEKPIRAGAACECSSPYPYQLHISEKTACDFMRAVRSKLPAYAALGDDNHDLRTALRSIMQDAKTALREAVERPQKPPKNEEAS